MTLCGREAAQPHSNTFIDKTGGLEKAREQCYSSMSLSHPVFSSQSWLFNFYSLAINLYVNFNNMLTQRCTLCCCSALTALLAMINCYSIKLSAKMMTVLTFLKLVACGFVIALGVYHLIRTGCLPEDSRHPFQGSTTNPVTWALALYGVMWACDAW